MNLKKAYQLYNKKKFYKKLIQKNSLCFDIGANLGFKSKILLGLGAEVIAFEPQLSCYAELKKLKNKKLILINKALGGKNYTGSLLIGNHIEIATLSNKFVKQFSSSQISWDKKQEVEIVTLNSQIEIFGVPNFCKIDTEGFEYEILKELNYTIPLIEFEFTEGFTEETAMCIHKLSNLGSYSFNYILNEKNKFELKKWTHKESILSIINTLPRENLHGNIFAKLG